MEHAAPYHLFMVGHHKIQWMCVLKGCQSSCPVATHGRILVEVFQQHAETEAAKLQAILVQAATDQPVCSPNTN